MDNYTKHKLLNQSKDNYTECKILNMNRDNHTEDWILNLNKDKDTAKNCVPLIYEALNQLQVQW